MVTTVAQDISPQAPTDRFDAAEIAGLNARFRHHSATDVMGFVLRNLDDTALVSNFGAESVVLLHMAAVINRDVPVIFIDTEMLFTETLIYQADLSEKLGLRNLQVIRARDVRSRDPEGKLHLNDPDSCCALRKTEPLSRALSRYRGWITGRKRFQSSARAALPFFEAESGTGRIKINPLAHWRREDVTTYIAENRLPRHPLVSQGYPSIGCAPCTTPVKQGENPRAGRWRNHSKDECGIHFVNGKMVRTGDIK